MFKSKGQEFYSKSYANLTRCFLDKSSNCRSSEKTGVWYMVSKFHIGDFYSRLDGLSLLGVQ